MFDSASSPASALPNIFFRHISIHREELLWDEAKFSCSTARSLSHTLDKKEDNRDGKCGLHKCALLSTVWQPGSHLRCLLEPLGPALSTEFPDVVASNPQHSTLSSSAHRFTIRGKEDVLLISLTNLC